MLLGNFNKRATVDSSDYELVDSISVVYHWRGCGMEIVKNDEVPSGR